MIIKRLAVLAAAGGLALALVACGSSSATTAAAPSSTGSSAMSSAAAPMSSAAAAPMSERTRCSSAPMSGAMSSAPMSDAMSSGATAAGAALVGPGCAAYAKAVPSGAGSVGGWPPTRSPLPRPTTRC